MIKKKKKRKKKTGWDDDEEDEIIEKKIMDKKNIETKPKISKLSNSPQKELESLLDF